MILQLNNLHTRVVSIDAAEMAWLLRYLEFRRAGKASRMYDSRSRSFPSGLLPMVQAAAATAGIGVGVMDMRAPGPPPPHTAALQWLRPYQEEAVQVALRHGRGILKLPTGAGKTEIAIGLAQLVRCGWLFLVHRAVLMRQTAERYQKRTGRLVGTIGDGEWKEEGEGFVVAMVETLAARLQAGSPRAWQLLNAAGGIIADECHLAAGAQYASILMAAPNARWRFGLSGTPLGRADRRSLVAIGALGPVIHEVRAPGLVDAGALARPTVTMLPHTASVPRGTTWGQVYEEAVVQAQSRNALLAKAIQRAARPTLVFVRAVQHGDQLARLLVGLRVAYVHGAHATAQRQAVVKAACAGRLDVVICSVIFQEGLDAPAFQHLVVAAGGKGEVGSIQRIGRVMRPAPGKDSGAVTDIDDHGCGCGGVHPGCRWLADHSRARVAAYIAEGYRTLGG